MLDEMGKNLDGVITSWNQAAERIEEFTASRLRCAGSLSQTTNSGDPRYRSWPRQPAKGTAKILRNYSQSSRELW